MTEIELPRVEKPERFDLACVGSSLSGYGNITMDAVRYIMAARVVYLYALNSEHLSNIQQYNPNIIDLNKSHYIDGTDCSIVYESVIELVLEDARRGGVAYVQQGSPSFLAFTSVQLLRRAATEGLKVCMLPGVSSLECLHAHLCRTYDIYDYQLYNCHSVVKGSAVPSPLSSLMLTNVSVYAAGVVSTHSNLLDPIRLNVLVQKLLCYYDQNHPIFLLHLRPEGGIHVIQCTLTSVVDKLLDATPGLTMFIPPL
ncbi:SAM-dependent methyltransferase [Bradyrhizobium diazoefficiens]|uniref:SAM-dependent methyltransferase n=1 Tax=Bradyrhizobium diazoefficiens TaxID=1355477 RepID=UPI0034770D7C